MGQVATRRERKAVAGEGNRAEPAGAAAAEPPLEAVEGSMGSGRSPVAEVAEGNRRPCRPSDLKP